VDEGGADAGVAVAAEERVGVAVVGVAVGGGGAVAALVDLVVAAAVGVEGGGVMEDVGHAAQRRRDCDYRFCLERLISFYIDFYTTRGVAPWWSGERMQL